MAKSIVVMGGSFNPSTIAHHKLMKAAMEQLGADKGIYVPVSAKYLRRKMRKAEYSALPEPGVRRVRATIPVGQSQCSRQ